MVPGERAPVNLSKVVNVTWPSSSTASGDAQPTAPAKSPGLLSDIRLFVLQKPAIPTLVEFTSEAEREDYGQRILQRLGISVTKYAILNIHRIGINVPSQFAFEELLRWDRDSVHWPNHLAAVEREEGRLEHVSIYLLDRRRHLLGIKNDMFGLNKIPLFRLDALKFESFPNSSDFDNARYLLYECSGGYPIGFFVTYVRSPIASRGEVEQTQVFFAVGFDFYGRDDWPSKHVINTIWERIHNRVTGNVLNRFKGLCEARFQEVLAGSRP
jgi:hypothetical protein